MVRINWVIDRFEEDWVVLTRSHDLENRSLPRNVLPPGAMPGDTLYQHEGRWRIDHAETATRAARIQTLFDRIKQNNTD